MSACGNCGSCDACTNPDAPPVDVIEQEEPELAHLHPVPVSLVGPVRTEELPSRNGGQGNRILRIGATAEQMFNEDPRRKRLILWSYGVAAGADGVCLAPTRQECDQFTGFLIFNSAVPVRYELASDSAWWARPFLMNISGSSLVSFIPSTADSILSWVVENWAR